MPLWAPAAARRDAGCHTYHFPIYSSRSSYEVGSENGPVLHCDLSEGRDHVFISVPAVPVAVHKR